MASITEMDVDMNQVNKEVSVTVLVHFRNMWFVVLRWKLFYWIVQFAMLVGGFKEGRIILEHDSDKDARIGKPLD
jgi:hypothetical protein